MTAPADWKEWCSSHHELQTGHATSKLNIPVWDSSKKKAGAIVAFVGGDYHSKAIVLYADGEIDTASYYALKWKGVTGYVK